MGLGGTVGGRRWFDSQRDSRWQFRPPAVHLVKAKGTMAMTKTLWTINALATEFDLDRRVVAKRIGHIRTASRVGEAKRWHLIDVLSVLTDRPPGERQDTYAISNVIGKRLNKTLDVRDVAVTPPV
jgi:hypothetical protein